MLATESAQAAARVEAEARDLGTILKDDPHVENVLKATVAVVRADVDAENV